MWMHNFPLGGIQQDAWYMVILWDNSLFCCGRMISCYSGIWCTVLHLSIAFVLLLRMRLRAEAEYCSCWWQVRLNLWASLWSRKLLWLPLLLSSLFQIKNILGHSGDSLSLLPKYICVQLWFLYLLLSYNFGIFYMIYNCDASWAAFASYALTLYSVVFLPKPCCCCML